MSLSDFQPSTKASSTKLVCVGSKRRRVGFTAVPAPTPVTVTINGARIISSLGRTKIQGLINDETLRSALIAGRRLIYYDSLMELLNRPTG
jgi:hypothetical protein